MFDTRYACVRNGKTQVSTCAKEHIASGDPLDRQIGRLKCHPYASQTGIIDTLRLKLSADVITPKTSKTVCQDRHSFAFFLASPWLSLRQ
jgi:hypothetical protein